MEIANVNVGAVPVFIAEFEQLFSHWILCVEVCLLPT